MEYSTDPQQYYYHQYQQQQGTAYGCYDQSAAYYANQQQLQYDQQQYNYPSYAHQQYHHEPVSVHPPGVPLQPDPSVLQNHQTLYYQSQGYQQPPLVDPGSTSDASRFNPAAAPPVAALPHLPHFSGNMDAAQRPVQPPKMQSANRGRRKGGKSFQGGGRGHAGYHGSAPSRKGHGCNGGRHFPHAAAPATVNSVLALTEGAAGLVPASASVHCPEPLPVPAQVPAAPLWPPPCMAWCELCRVDCNTPEILEQHKNGKRHKKNLQVHEELQKLTKTGEQILKIPNTTEAEISQAEKIDRSKGKQLEQESLSLPVADNSSKETELQKDIVDKSEASTVDSAEGKMKSRDHIETWGGGLKRKMRGGRGGKYMRPNQGPRRPVEPPKSKEVIPLICELCNVKCESQVVFNSHLAGKKHIANLKRFHGHRALYGEAGLQALYPPNFSTLSSSSVPQAQQGIADPQLLLAQLLTYVLSQAQAPGLVACQVAGAAATLASAQAPVSGLETHYAHNCQTQGSLATSETERKIIIQAEAESQLRSTTVNFGAPASTGTDTNVDNGTSESGKAVSLVQYNSVKAPADIPATLAKQVPAIALEKNVCAPESENALDSAAQSVTGNNTQELEENPEEEEPEEEPEREMNT